jgi:hypothetical protein
MSIFINMTKEEIQRTAKEQEVSIATANRIVRREYVSDAIRRQPNLELREILYYLLSHIPV